VNAANSQDGPVHLMAELHHGVGFVEVVSRKKSGDKSPESALSGDEDIAGVGPAAGSVEQPEQHAVRTHALEFVKIARDTLGVVHGSDFGIAQPGDIAVERVC
jgi:hypothetical protein